jgi:hypothetical protein
MILALGRSVASEITTRPELGSENYLCKFSVGASMPFIAIQL